MNYTEKQEAALRAAEPVTYAEAVAFGVEFGRSTRSVISKVKQLDLEYVRKPVADPKPAVPTKAELVAEIEVALGADEGTFAGLDAARADALGLVLAFAEAPEAFVDGEDFTG